MFSLPSGNVQELYITTRTKTHILHIIIYTERIKKESPKSKIRPKSYILEYLGYIL